MNMMSSAASVPLVLISVRYMHLLAGHSGLKNRDLNSMMRTGAKNISNPWRRIRKRGIGCVVPVEGSDC